MSLTRNRSKLAAFLLAGAVACTAARAQNASTNARPAGPEKTLPGQGVMDKFEDNVFGSHKALDIRAPGTDTPNIQRLVPPPQLDERTREKLDAERDWAFSGMNALGSRPTPEDILGTSDLGPDGMPKQKMSAMEKFYNNLGAKPQTGSSNQLADVMTMMWTVKQLGCTNGINPLVFAFPPGDQSLLKTLMTMPDLSHQKGDDSQSDDSRSAVSLKAAQGAAAADKEQKRRLDEFKQLIGMQPSGPVETSSPFGDFKSSSSSGFYNPVPAPAPTPVAPPAAPSSLSPVMGAFTAGGFGAAHPFDAGLNNSGLPSLGSSAPVHPSTSPAPAPIQAAPIDPFAQNFPKRKF